MKRQHILIAILGIAVVITTLISGVWLAGTQRAAVAAIECPTKGFLTDLPQPERDICLERKFDALEQERAQRQNRQLNPAPATDEADVQTTATEEPDAEMLAAERALEQELAATAAAEILQQVHVVRPVERAEFVGSTLFVGSTSIWQNSAVEDVENQIWRALYVYAMPAFPPENRPSRIISTILADPTPALGARYERTWAPPEPIGDLTITGVDGNVDGIVSFTTSTGKAGTLDMQTGAWVIQN
jgi:hypothetical protein